MILFYARKRYATCSSDDRLTTGSVGVEVVFHFSDDWAAAPSRIAVFRGSGVSVDVALLEDRCTVPPEVLTQPGSTLTIGVYGTDGAGTVVIPTVYAEAGQIRRGAEPSGVEPTPQTQPLIDQLLAAAQAARDAADEAERLAQSVRDDADAGEFDGADGQDGQDGAPGQDGADGNSIWTATQAPIDVSATIAYYYPQQLTGRDGIAPAIGDIVIQSAKTVWEVFGFTVSGYPKVRSIGSIKGNTGADGEDGYSPVVTITEITGGHRITITDEDHPSGQSFDVMDGQGGSGSSDYNDLSNKPQIAGVTLSGNKSLADLGIAAASDIPTVPVQSVNGKTGAVVLNASDVGAGTYTKPSGGIPKTDLAAAVQTSLGKADTALQTAVTSFNGSTGAVTYTAPVTSVNGQTGAVTVPEPFFVTYSTSDMTTWTCDKTFAQITAAIAAGKQVVMLLSVVGTPFCQAGSFLIFQQAIQVWVRFGSNTRYQISHSDDNTVSVDEFTENAAWIEAVADNQGVSHAGEFLVVGSNGYVTTMTLSTWSAGSY